MQTATLNIRDYHVGNIIEGLLKRKGQDSENTEKSYRKVIARFFKYKCGKDFKFLNPDDLETNRSYVVKYQTSLREQYKTSTVNHEMTILKRLYREFEENDLPVKSSWFDVERYKEYDTESYDTLSHDEVFEIIEYFENKGKKNLQKALLVRIAYSTAFRRSTLLSLTPSNIIEREGIKYFKAYGKGNKLSYKIIDNTLSDIIDEHIKKNNIQDDEYIIQLTDRTVTRMMNEIRKQFDFGDRHIVFHSFKKASIDEVGRITGGDVKAMQIHGDHSSASTTLDSYVMRDTFEGLTPVSLESCSNVREDLEAFSKEELLNAIEKLDRSSQFKLLSVLK